MANNLRSVLPDWAVLFMFLSFILLVFSGISSCSRGSESTGGLVLLSCSLGCSETGNCSVSEIAANQVIIFRFSKELSLASISSASVEVQTVNGGILANASLEVESNELRIRPLITFDPQTFQPSALDPKPYQIHFPASPNKVTIYSKEGDPLASEILCTVTPTEDLIDAVPGSPNVSLSLPEPFSLGNSGETPIVVEFDDIMNPATIIDSLGKSPSVFVEADLDGNSKTVFDRVLIPGKFEMGFSGTSTQLVFVPDITMAGSLERLITVSVFFNAEDLAKNNVANPGVFEFTVSPLDPDKIEEVIVESFGVTSKEDNLRTGALWGVDGAKLLPGAPGGLGIFGDLFVDDEQILNLDTNKILFEKPLATPSGISCYQNPDNFKGMENGYLPIAVNNNCEEISLFEALQVGNSIDVSRQGF